MDERELALRLRENIKNVFEELLLNIKNVALLDFPNHANVGDSAIWAGEKEILKKLGITVKYQCDLKNYSAQALKKAFPKGPILIHGGGNFGDIWPAHESFRHQIVTDFPDRKIIQLPQSVFYQRAAEREAAARIYSKHRDFTILARDAESRKIVTDEMGLNSQLCPDSAFALNLRRSSPPSADVICLKRTDSEGGLKDDVERYASLNVDWLADIDWWGLRILNFLENLRMKYPRRFAFFANIRKMQYDKLARKRVQYGIDILSRGKVVVTDRLHAHILCFLCQIPHVLIDNSYGKLSNYYDTWTKDSDITFWAKTFDEGVELAQEITKKDGLMENKESGSRGIRA